MTTNSQDMQNEWYSTNRAGTRMGSADTSGAVPGRGPGIEDRALQGRDVWRPAGRV